MLWTTILMATLGLTTANFQVEIVHTNDMHSRFFQTNKVSGECSKEDANKGNCYGGFARVAEAVRLANFRNRNKKTLFLIAGDIFQGTIWYTMYKWRIASALTNLLKPDAMSLGNHEFDDGVKGLIPFINNATFPILATNLDLSKEPELRRTKLKNSTIFLGEGGEKIAVIGYVTPETKFLSQADDVEFLDEVKSINTEIERLKKNNPDLKIFIALGHSGYEMDKKIAEHVPDIDVVIGGHTNTFLYSGIEPDNEIPEGLYPTWVTQKSGRKVPVVQAYAYTKYLGQLHLEFNTDGEVINATGNPLLLDKSIGQDPFILQELKKWEKNMSIVVEQPIGETKVFLQGEGIHCRLEECNLGNLIADAFVDYMAGMYQGTGWTNAPIAIYSGGAVRSSIDASNKNGKVSLKDILGVLPFVNNMVLMRMNGSDIMEMLEWSVEDYSRSERKGKFLQMSGLKVVYDLSKPNKQRVVKAYARCGNCRVPVYEPVKSKQSYNVLMPAFNANGGDGYTMIKKLFKSHYEMDTTDTDMVKDYFLKKSPVYTGIEGRIKFVNHAEDLSKGSASSITKTHFLSLLVALLTVVRTT